MARYPEWFDRLEDLVSTLAAGETPAQLGRHEVEALFGTSPRDSLRLLNRFGAERSGEALTLARNSLLAQLEALREQPTYRAYRAQRAAVARTVMRETAAARQGPQHPKRQRISGTVDFAGSETLADLPAAIELRPGQLVVNFTYPEDLWHLLDRLANVAAADREAFEKRVAVPQQ